MLKFSCRLIMRVATLLAMATKELTAPIFVSPVATQRLPHCRMKVAKLRLVSGIAPLPPGTDGLEAFFHWRTVVASLTATSRRILNPLT
jgi:hypothetical protein